MSAPNTFPPAPSARRLDLLVIATALATLVAEAWHLRGGEGAVAFGAAAALAATMLLRAWLTARDAVDVQASYAAAHAAAEASEMRFRSLVQNSHDIILVVDSTGFVRYASPSVERTLGITRESPESETLLAWVHPDDADAAGEAFARAVREPGTTGPFQCRVRSIDGAWRNMECVTTNLCDDLSVNGVVINVRDVTERAALEAQLLHQAFHDPLTGLANRVLFRDRVSHALAREGRHPEGVVALFLDLDDFKTVNDSLGHREGDRMLSVVAGRLLNATRGCDTVARLGGDEFAVLLENARSEDDAITVADRIVTALRAPITLGGQEVQVGASIGIARSRPEDGAEELLRNADVAMYKAKQRGKNTYEVFAPAMHAALVDRLEREAELRRAVSEGCREFRVHYQPIVALSGGEITGVEALVRWQHPRRGLVAPLDFIPSAEATGLIVPLGRWVLREACSQAARWQAARDRMGAAAPLTITVNLSGRQLQHASIVDDVRWALDGAGLAPAALVLEITESVIMQDTQATLATLHALKSLGVRLAVDDFGTGYSSLGYLQRFPIDILKIDKAFVDGVARGGSRSALARTIVALGDSLSLHCVAEGIEEDVQWQHLKALGCGFGQGYLFARPLPANDVSALVCPITR